jgi:nitrogen-specific signal transduction histidine kinase
MTEKANSTFLISKMLRLEGTNIKFRYFLSVSLTKKEKQPLTERRQRESKNISVK